WDYRYAWLRDASFTVYSLMRLGFLEEAASFMDWLQQRCELATAEGDLSIMYAIDGSDHFPEETLDHLEGYRGTRPVRIGNGAAGDRGLHVPIERWRDLAAQAHRFVQEQCWVPGLSSYVMHPGSQLLDAALLIMPLVRFAGPTDPRFLSTLERISEGLVADSL